MPHSTDTTLELPTTVHFEFPAGESTVCRGLVFGNPQESKQIVAITGAIGMVQEQAPWQYARRLSALGMTCLTFDHRYFGESDGEPRQFENPLHKAADLIALGEFIKEGGGPLQFPNDSTVSLLGICKGGAYSLRAARLSHAVDRFIGVSGFYFDDVSLEAEKGYKAQRIAQGKAALQKYEETGEVDYLPIVHDKRQDAALPYPALYAWYSPWEEKSRWENRYAVMSDYFIYNYDSAEDAQNLRKPALIIHGNKSTNPGSARRVFDQIPHPDKSFLFYEDGVDFQTNFYDREELIDRACGDIAGWLMQTEGA